jgi:hypothetical protein
MPALSHLKKIFASMSMYQKLQPVSLVQQSDLIRARHVEPRKILCSRKVASHALQCHSSLATFEHASRVKYGKRRCMTPPWEKSQNTKAFAVRVNASGPPASKETDKSASPAATEDQVGI